MLVEDKTVELAFNWLEENRQASAAAKALRIRAEYDVKKAKAKGFLEATGNNAEREAQALMTEEYDKAVLAEIEAIENDE